MLYLSLIGDEEECTWVQNSLWRVACSNCMIYCRYHDYYINMYCMFSSIRCHSIHHLCLITLFYLRRHGLARQNWNPLMLIFRCDEIVHYSVLALFSHTLLIMIWKRALPKSLKSIEFRAVDNLCSHPRGVCWFFFILSE